MQVSTKRFTFHHMYKSIFLTKDSGLVQAEGYERTCEVCSPKMPVLLLLHQGASTGV